MGERRNARRASSRDSTLELESSDGGSSSGATHFWRRFQSNTKGRVMTLGSPLGLGGNVVSSIAPAMSTMMASRISVALTPPPPPHALRRRHERVRAEPRLTHRPVRLDRHLHRDDAARPRQRPQGFVQRRQRPRQRLRRRRLRVAVVAQSPSNHRRGVVEPPVDDQPPQPRVARPAHGLHAVRHARVEREQAVELGLDEPNQIVPLHRRVGVEAAPILKRLGTEEDRLPARERAGGGRVAFAFRAFLG